MSHIKPFFNKKAPPKINLETVAESDVPAKISQTTKAKDVSQRLHNSGIKHLKNPDNLKRVQIRKPVNSYTK